MDKSRLEWKVGLFVCIGLVLLAALLLQFSKGGTFFRPGYELFLRAKTVGGLKVRAQVLMSGIQVGSVSRMRLDPDGRSVIITLRIFQQYKIFKDATFAIEQSGFLGDQFIAILPTENEGEVFRPGEEASASSPLDLQEVARKVGDLLGQIGTTATRINTTITNAQNTALSERSFTNLAIAFSNLSRVSDRSVAVVENVHSIVESNRASFTAAVSNLTAFLEQANDVSGKLDSLLATNAPELEGALKDMRSSSASLKRLLEGVEQGRGVAGRLLVDEGVAANLSEIASNLSITTANLSVTTSNLNQRGLWGILWKQKPPRTNAPVAARGPLTSPKNPYN
jgi:phospholipid/cholesterol/gamma-HCH transport system substrate-binding protein